MEVHTLLMCLITESVDCKSSKEEKKLFLCSHRFASSENSFPTLTIAISHKLETMKLCFKKNTRGDVNFGGSII